MVPVPGPARSPPSIWRNVTCGSPSRPLTARNCRPHPSPAYLRLLLSSSASERQSRASHVHPSLAFVTQVPRLHADGDHLRLQSLGLPACNCLSATFARIHVRMSCSLHAALPTLVGCNRHGTLQTYATRNALLHIVTCVYHLTARASTRSGRDAAATSAPVLARPLEVTSQSSYPCPVSPRDPVPLSIPQTQHTTGPSSSPDPSKVGDAPDPL